MSILSFTRSRRAGGQRAGFGRGARLAVLGAASLAALALVPATVRAQAATRMIIVTGLGGEKKYSESFATLGASLAEAANKRFGIPEADVLWFSEDSVSRKPYFKGQSTKANIERAITGLASRAAPGDQIIIVLIGHGSGEGAATKISIPGPDLTAADFAALLNRLPTQKIAFLNLTSGGGDMLPVLSAPNRVIITATKSAFERNETHFARFFVEALTKDVADTDKDNRVSLLEAFRYASVETKRLYENDSRLQTEHAQLDDMGAKQGVAEPDGKTGQGLLARRFFFDGAFASGTGANDPRLASLYQEKFTLEDRIDRLRLEKSKMTADAYDDALEALLVELARKAKAIREIEGRKS